MTSASAWGLWVTRQALEDIGIAGAAGPSFDLEAMAQRHRILKAFRDKRGSDPRGSEKTQGIKRDIYNLHGQDPFRGVTWYDNVQGVVFLLAVTRDHDYSIFVDREMEGTLGPLEIDYADYFQSCIPFESYEDFLEDAETDIAPLLARALANPGKLVEGVLGKELPVAVHVEVLVLNEPSQPADVYVAVSFNDRSKTVELPPTVLSDLADILFPDAEPEHVDIGGSYFPPPRNMKVGDFIFRWRRP